jgi:hypothetical protein
VEDSCASGVRGPWDGVWVSRELSAARSGVSSSLGSITASGREGGVDGVTKRLACEAGTLSLREAGRATSPGSGGPSQSSVVY